MSPMPAGACHLFADLDPESVNGASENPATVAKAAPRAMSGRRIMKPAMAAAALALAGLAQAQTPAQMDYDRQQRDYWRAQEQQRQEQQRQQQMQNENAARQQQESADAARRSQEPSRRSDEPFGRDMDAAHARQQQALQDSRGQAAQWEAARQSWLKKPALAPASNPLLGRWTRPASSRGNGSDPFAALAALAKGGLCEVLFGDGMFEFRPGTLVGIDRAAREQELDQVEYRGDARQVAVIPKTTLKLMLWEFDGPDRIHWQGQNCAMVRVKAPSAAAGGATAVRPAAPEVTGARPATSPPGASATPAADAVLALVAGLDGSPLAGTKFIVLRHSVEVALTSAGFRPPPGVTAFKAWSLECQRRSPACQQGVQGIRADGLGVLQTDARGQAQAPRLAAGSYYVFGSARQGDRQWLWNQRVELKQGMNSIRLDASNASAVN